MRQSNLYLKGCMTLVRGGCLKRSALRAAPELPPHARTWGSRICTILHSAMLSYLLLEAGTSGKKQENKTSYDV